MKLKNLRIILFITLIGAPFLQAEETEWELDSEKSWKSNLASSHGAVFEGDSVSPKEGKATLLTKLQSFDKKRSAISLTIAQSPVWQNWIPIENLGPSNLSDAPVLLTMGPNDYWIFGRYSNEEPQRQKDQQTKPLVKHIPSEIKLVGFDTPLLTTRFPNQYDAPGGLKPGRGGYHAWQSRDMKSWVHHGPVTEGFSKWVTSAEMIDGKALIYYDFPNDQDPHVYVDSDLTDGEPGENKGIAVRDPSHGSDAGFIRDLDGRMHVFAEDWSPINASKYSWDSPLAAHAVSPNGIDGFVFQAPPVDNRTSPTGKKSTYSHPHWMKEDPKNYPTNVAEYDVHEPEQEAYGDWAAISIGGQYYLFGDYDPVGDQERARNNFRFYSLIGITL